MREIGSEFWLEHSPKDFNCGVPDWIRNGEHCVLLFSGRTAIDFVLNDINTNIKSIYMPSYCCSSMLQPFIDRGISIDFYDVVFDSTKGLRYEIDLNKKCDIFYATSYFGFSETTMDFIIDYFNRKGIIVIEDITHRLLSKDSFCHKADYSIASLRKWFPIPSGGLAIKIEGSFSSQFIKEPPRLLVETKVEAMRRKAIYVKNKKKENLPILKKNFSEMFHNFNHGIEDCYRGIHIDELSSQILFELSLESIREKRRENAAFLYDYLNQSQFINLFIKKPDFSVDCPLFVPIRLSPEFKILMRDYLIMKEIYCPVHWPISKVISLNEKTREVYEQEISLVCDQRYDLRDMERLINTLEGFWSTLC